MEVSPFNHLKNWLSAGEAGALLATLEARSDWTQGRIRMFGREIPEPRLTFFEGDPGVRYTYAHRSLEGKGWTPELEALRERFARDFGIQTNTVLANLYRDGQDSMGWHRDHEPEAADDVTSDHAPGENARQRSSWSPSSGQRRVRRHTPLWACP